MEALKLVSPEPRSIDLDDVNARLADADAEETIAWAAEAFGAGLVMSSSFGSHSALMLHLATRVVPRIPVVFLDTGYLFPETYQFAEAMRERFDLRLEVFNPRMTAARQEALFGRLWDGDEADLRRYQQLNKVEPMQRALDELHAGTWFAGLRRDQSSTRSDTPFLSWKHGRAKVHPIADWSDREVHAYLTRHRLPYHPLWLRGYVSIGDTHSTVPLGSGMRAEDTRFGGVKRECGLHTES